MPGKNCWEFKNCGRQPGGAKEKEFGVCPASTDARLNGTNNGKNGGRACWALTGTLCGGKIQGTFASKLGNCMACEFYAMVKKEEGTACESSNDILKKLR